MFLFIIVQTISLYLTFILLMFFFIFLLFFSLAFISPFDKRDIVINTFMLLLLDFHQKTCDCIKKNLSGKVQCCCKQCSFDILLNSIFFFYNHQHKTDLTELELNALQYILFYMVIVVMFILYQKATKYHT